MVRTRAGSRGEQGPGELDSQRPLFDGGLEQNRLRLAIFAKHAILMLRKPVMPTRNVNLTDELDTFVSDKIESGRYENASEVVRAALRMLEREEKEFEAKLVALRAAIDEGDASGVAEGGAFERARQRLQLSKKRR
jgi:antitoxin ParD1/3/4